jgi:hypothetical protein
VIASTDFDYTINSGLSDGFDQNVPLLECASIAYQVLKKRDGEIKLGVFDILNQNKSLTHNTGDNYIQDVRSNVLKRYFMLSFTYNFRHGDKQQIITFKYQGSFKEYEESSVCRTREGYTFYGTLRTSFQYSIINAQFQCSMRGHQSHQS